MHRNTKIGLLLLAVSFGPSLAVAQTTTQSWQTSPVSAATGSSAPVTGDCDPTVHQGLVNLANQQIQNQTALASYLYPYEPSDSSFLQNSCVNNLLNGSLNILFEPPNLNGIIQGLINQGCNYLASMKNQALQPVESIANTIDSTEQQGLSFGQVAPGLNLGGVSNVLSVNVQSGGNNSQGLVQTNITSMFTDSSGSSVVSGSYQNGLFGSGAQ
jgi:hypothetical protein